MWACVAGFVFFTVGTLGGWLYETQEGEKLAEKMAYAGLWFALACLCLLLVVHSSVVYYWDEERVGSRLLWRNRSMQWDEVLSFRVREWLGQFIYVLTDTWGRRLSFDIEALGTNHPLHLVLKDKLRHLVENEKRGAAVPAHPEFPVRFLRVNFRSFRLRDNSFVVKGLFRSREVPLSELYEVRQFTQRQYGSKTESVALVFRNGSVIGIPHITTGYFRLLEHLKSRAPNAIWFHARGLEPEGRATKIAFWKYRTEALRRATKQVLLSGTAMIVLFAVLVTRLMARRAWQLPPDAIPVVRLACGFVATSVALTAWTCARYPRRLKALRERLAAAEDEEEGGKEIEPNHTEKEEDRE